MADKNQTHPPDPIDGLSQVRVLALVTQLKAILRPSARRDLERYVEATKDKKSLAELLHWGDRVLRENYTERYKLFQPKTRLAVQSAPERVFRKPERAFKIRWMHRPLNIKAARLARKTQLKKKADRRIKN